jgi:hypothetical protein
LSRFHNFHFFNALPWFPMLLPQCFYCPHFGEVGSRRDLFFLLLWTFCSVSWFKVLNHLVQRFRLVQRFNIAHAADPAGLRIIDKFSVTLNCNFTCISFTCVRSIRIQQWQAFLQFVYRAFFLVAFD